MNAAARWRDALSVAALVAIDPAGLGGVAVAARHGPVRSDWLAALERLLPTGLARVRVPPHVADDRLLGGIDLGATLAAGRPVARVGLLAEADGGIAILPMAERAEPALLGRLGAALDSGRLRAEREGLSLDVPARFAVIALDESEAEEEDLATALADRLAFRLDLDGLAHRDIAPPPFTPADIAAARAALPGIAADPAGEAALTTTALACGIGSLRAPILAARAARALRALYGPALGTAEAAEIAARLVLAPRAVTLPPEAEAEPEPDDLPPPDPPEETESAAPETETGPLPDRVLEAVRAALPADLLARMAAGAVPRAAAAGRAGAERRAPDRGRPIGARPGVPGGRNRLDLVDTLRSAAPWQRLRRMQMPDAPAGQVLIRPDDFRIRRFKRRSGTTTIFVVDASGSAAVARLAEAKGAIELLLADAYVRRDRVALVAFRGAGAEILLPPTQSPALAKKRLAALPGGGGTPIAAGLEAGLMLAERVRTAGSAPFLVVLTDGGANIARDGTQGRAAAREDAHDAGAALARAGVPGLVIDTGARPRREAEDLARAMAARYLPMPRADAALLSRAARQATTG